MAFGVVGAGVIYGDTSTLADPEGPVNRWTFVIVADFDLGIPVAVLLPPTLPQARSIRVDKGTAQCDLVV